MVAGDGRGRRGGHAAPRPRPPCAPRAAVAAARAQLAAAAPLGTLTGARHAARVRRGFSPACRDRRRTVHHRRPSRRPRRSPARWIIAIASPGRRASTRPGGRFAVRAPGPPRSRPPRARSTAARSRACWERSISAHCRAARCRSRSCRCRFSASATLRRAPSGQASLLSETYGSTAADRPPALRARCSMAYPRRAGRGEDRTGDLGGDAAAARPAG